MKRWLPLLLGLALLAATTVYADDGSAESFFYRGETVTELYSLDYPGRTYQRVTEQADMKAVLESLDGYQEANLSGEDLRGQVGFLIKTSKDKYTVAVPPAQRCVNARDRELAELSERLNREYPRQIQWFCFMDEENIERIQFDGWTGGLYSRDPGKFPDQKLAQIDVTDRAKIEQISGYLKEMQVLPATGIYIEKENFRNPSAAAGLYGLTIYFKNNIRYYCYGDFITISSSDMNEQIRYEGAFGESDGQIQGLRDLMRQLQQ